MLYNNRDHLSQSCKEAIALRCANSKPRPNSDSESVHNLHSRLMKDRRVKSASDILQRGEDHGCRPREKEDLVDTDTEVFKIPTEERDRKSVV